MINLKQKLFTRKYILNYFIITTFILLLLFMYFKVKTPLLIFSLFLLSSGIMFFKNSKNTSVMFYKLTNLISSIIVFLYGFFVLYNSLKFEVPYVYNAILLKKYFNQKKIYYEKKEINLKTKKEIIKVLTFKEIFLGDIYFSDDIEKKKIYFFIMNDGKKLEIIEDTSGHYYIHISKRYNKKIN